MFLKVITIYLSFTSIQEKFDSYLMNFNKTYIGNEYWKRLDIFQNNIEYINEHNDNNLNNYTLGLTPFTDITNEEFQSKYFVKSSEESPCTLINTGSILLKKKRDWRVNNAVTNVKNQLNCGGCWSFSAVGALEGIRSINGYGLDSLSEQQLIDCSEENKGCSGGSMDLAFDYVINNGGICSNTSYQYKAKNQYCNSSCNILKHTDIKTCYDVLPKKEHLFLSYLEKQPLSVAIQANGMNFQHYKNGIFDDINCYNGQLDHGVLAVAYDENTITLKNSWGTFWGENGYINLQRTGNGPGVCGVLMMASFPSY